MAVRRSATLDTRELFAEYPFLPGAESLVDELAPSLRELLSDGAYARARELGRARVRSAMADPTGATGVAELAHATQEEQYLSFFFARLVLSAAPTQGPLRRWAVAEAKRGWSRLDSAEVAEFLEVGRRLGHEFAPTPGGIALPLADYLHLATGIREADFRLVRQAVHRGRVDVARPRAVRLLQEGIRARLTLPIELSPEARDRIRAEEAELLADVQSRMPVPTTRALPPGGAVLVDRFPPCMRKMRRMLEAGENLSHAGRFALAAFLHRAGADFDAIVDFYRGAPDFDESVTRYQVEHITRHDEGRGYTPPDCATLRTHGLCFREGDPTATRPEDQQRDPRCFDESLRRPIQYYVRRGGLVVNRSAEEATPAPPRSGSGTPSGPGPTP
jgi:DNA primase large subunit